MALRPFLRAAVVTGLVGLVSACQTTTGGNARPTGVLELSDIPGFNPAITPPEVHGKPVNIVAKRDKFFAANPSEEFFLLVVHEGGGGAFFRKDGSVKWHRRPLENDKSFETKVIYSSSHMTCIAPINDRNFFGGSCFYLRQLADGSYDVWFTAAPLPLPKSRQYIKTFHHAGVTFPL